jgi:hypothetical protein
MPKMRKKLKPLSFIPGTPRAVKPLLACLVLLFVAVVALCAQEKGISAGGKWMEFDTEDPMTAAKKVRFELDGDNFLRGGDAKPKILIFCANGKHELSDFRPNAKIAPPNRPGFWGQPQMEVTVRVDNAHSNHGWNWVNGDFLSMDKGTTRELIGAQLFKVEALTADGPQIATFSPAGLDLKRVRQACDLTPRKP